MAERWYRFKDRLERRAHHWRMTTWDWWWSWTLATLMLLLALVVLP